MSAFEDDVEPLDEARSRGGTPFGRGGRAQAAAAASSSSAVAAAARIPSPEPDEDFDTSQGKHSMWLVKVPRFLLEGWSKVDEENRRLGTVRVYDPDHRGRQRMELLLPEPPEPAIPLPPSHPYLQTNYPRKYDLRITSGHDSARVRNLYAFKERQEGGDEDDDDDDDDDSEAEDNNGKRRATSTAVDDRKPKGRRVVTMVGTIANEAALKPQVAPPILRTGGGGAAGGGVGLTPEYREVLRKRRLEASKPRASVKVLDESDRSHAIMLSSGVQAHSNKQSKASLIAGTGAAAAASAAARRNHAANEKFARMPRNELLDMLFELFDQYPYWSIKGLRAKVQQPEAYLREVMTSIADLHKRGPYSGNWSLKQEFVEMRRQQDRDANATAAAIGMANSAAAAAQAAAGGASGSGGAGGAQPTANGGTASKGGEDDDDDDDDDDEEDLAMEDVV